MGTIPSHGVSSEEQPPQQSNRHQTGDGEAVSSWVLVRQSIFNGISDLGHGAWAVGQQLFNKIIKPSMEKMAAFLLSAIEKSCPHIHQAIFEVIKDTWRTIWAFWKWLVKAFLSKVLPIILLMVLIRLALPYLIPFIGYVVTQFLRWLFEPLRTLPHEIFHPFQALWHGVERIGHGIGHGVSAVGHGLGRGARAWGHGAVGIGHGASFVGHGLGI
ncbi:MAG: hypothetical protein F4Z75_07290 [Synechococcus sp. SB0668_bin_15]|nr:hypothetical protein [Synechococcus sp. SB0668_bin_15]MXZ82477.1 hypothetical protein [Synechococcus sp. SB0666_bin_14]MYA90981.1 hypothetical protein [Synechococcus sp. SB0663_bin_10]MYC50036.1 hypothetical protein [Synechococcus sp. SB0662_bin_14]MYG47711.1 hypothetical protein [Synechococcus sp. SB0675_bin_6]MYJ59677.1 hypothetical protein [Synechococcus sp. SB0672_bin_6]